MAGTLSLLRLPLGPLPRGQGGLNSCLPQQGCFLGSSFIYCLCDGFLPWWNLKAKEITPQVLWQLERVKTSRQKPSLSEDFC